MLRQVFGGAGRIGEPTRTSSTRVGLVGSAALHLAVLLLLLGLPHRAPEDEAPPETTVAMMFQGATRAGPSGPTHTETPAPTQAEAPATEAPRPPEAVPPAPSPPNSKASPPTPAPPLPMPPKPMPPPPEAAPVPVPPPRPSPPVPLAPPLAPPAPAPPPKPEQTLPLPLPPPVPPPPNPGSTASSASAKSTAANSSAVESVIDRLRQQNAQPQSAKGHANRPAAQPNDGNPLGNDTAALNAEQRGAIGDHVRECWTKDAGALDVDKQRVLLTVTTDAEGVVHRAEIAGEDVARMGDPRFRAFAERARRAIMSPSCANLPLPGNALGRVNVLTFRFSP